MAVAIDADRWRSASHRNMIEHLTGPFAGGAVESGLTVTLVDGAAMVAVTWTTREPLVVVAPRVGLERASWRVAASRVAPAQASEPQAPVVFAAWTEAGAFLPLYRPPVDDGTRQAAAFALQVTLIVNDPAAAEAEMPAEHIAGNLEIRVIEGVLGRLVFAFGLEHGRLRREAREIAAMRRLSTARDDALDRIGGELGVPRFEDDFAKPADGAGGWIARREPDEEYRRRLAIFRPFLLPSRGALLDRLNGSAADPDNAGLLAGLGPAPRLELADGDNPFAVAIHLVDAVDAGGPPRRDNFLQFIRRVHLVHPLPEGDPIHAARFLPAERKQNIDDARRRLSGGFAWPADAALAPMLAAALDRVAQIRTALGDGSAWTVVRAQDGNAGSRFELGLGVELKPPDGAALDALAAAANDPNRPRAADEEVEAILRGATAAGAAADPLGNWLLEPCGLRTVHPLDNGNVYLSHLPTFGMAIAGPSVADPGASTPFEVRYHAPGDPGGNVVLTAALAQALQAWTAGGNEPLARLTDDDARAAWDQAATNADNAGTLAILRAAGLPASGAVDLSHAVDALKRLPPEMVASMTLPAALAAALVADDEQAAAALRALTALLRRASLASVLPLVIANDKVALVVGVIGLPAVGVNLADRRTTGFRWYAAPVEGAGGAIKAIGSRTAFVPAGSGLTALVALGYARRDATDPYEFRVEAPDGATLTFKQYEYLMNLLAHDCPIGVEINTFALRREHVDFAGDAAADPMTPTAARTYRAFRRARLRG